MDLSTKALHLLNPERAHRLTIRAMASGLYPRMAADARPELATRVMGLDFPNPFGIAAGFDKHGEAIAACHGMGLGFAEIGSVTPLPQAGNPKPRVFRLKDQQGIINRYGFNSEGMQAVAKRLEKWRRKPTGVLGVNLGKNKETEVALNDYLLGAKALAKYADYLVVNVSSPNTPGLRGEQSPEKLKPLLDAMKNELQGDTPLVLKVAPDLTDQDISDISGVILEAQIDVLMVSNTTLSRPAGCDIGEAGGLSGRPVFDISTKALADFNRVLAGRIPLIGVGGVASAEDAMAKFRAGASLVQFYSALVYRGHGLVRELLTDVTNAAQREAR